MHTSRNRQILGIRKLSLKWKCLNDENFGDINQNPKALQSLNDNMKINDLGAHNSPKYMSVLQIVSLTTKHP